MKKIILAFFLFCNFAAFAQQDALFTQYMFNKQLVNPAYAGSKEVFTIDMLNRTQWVNIPGAPETFTLSAHTAMRNKHVGLGFYLIRDVLGASIQQSLMGTYAYRLYFSKSSLAFGLQFGAKYFDYNWEEFNLHNSEDYVFNPKDIRRFTPDANFGIYYQSNRIFLGVSSKQLLKNNYGLAIDKDGKTSFSSLTRHFYIMGGFAFPIVEKIIFRPSLLTKYTPNAPLQLDINGSFLFGNVFWAGISTRAENGLTFNAVTFLTEVKITDQLRVGYSFDLYINELQKFNYGSHEIRLGYEFPLYESRMRTPRYF